MNRWLSFRSVVVVLVVGALVLSSSPALAGYATINGAVSTTQYTWFSDNPRTIVDSAQPGPEVAFRQLNGPAGLQLGAYRCGQIGTFPWGRYPQDPGIFRTVADGVPDRTRFCLFSLSSSGSGNFSGNLDWD